MTPPQPPEGALIEGARKGIEMSARDAARRAGISEGWWRQVTRGYQKLSGGEFGPVRAPAKTIATMARAVGITPEQLESEGGRPDAAGVLRKIGGQPSPPLTAVPDNADAATVYDLVDRMLTDKVERMIWHTPGLTLAEKAVHIDDYRAAKARAGAKIAEEDRDSGTALSMIT